MSKYLFYAAGEIILVVVGILIALQVNNWNHQRMEKMKEEKYLKSIVGDLSQQIVDLEAYISTEKFFYDNSNYLLKLMAESEDFRINDEFFAKLNSLTVRKTFNPIMTTFEELTSSGNIGLISDQMLKTKLVKFYNELERKSSVINNNNLQIVDAICQPVILNTSLMYIQDLSDAKIVASNKLYEGHGIDRMKEEAIRGLKDPVVARLLFNILEQRTLIAKRHLDYYRMLKEELSALVEQMELQLI